MAGLYQVPDNPLKSGGRQLGDRGVSHLANYVSEWPEQQKINPFSGRFWRREYLHARLHFSSQLASNLRGNLIQPPKVINQLQHGVVELLEVGSINVDSDMVLDRHHP